MNIFETLDKTNKLLKKLLRMRLSVSVPANEKKTVCVSSLPLSKRVYPFFYVVEPPEQTNTLLFECIILLPSGAIIVHKHLVIWIVYFLH